MPVAAFIPDDDTPAIGQPVTFMSTSGGQPPLKVFWDFGDGTTLVGQQQPTHVYNRGGTYRVRLTIENDFGRSEAVRDVVGLSLQRRGVDNAGGGLRPGYLLGLLFAVALWSLKIPHQW